jgi:hypothetical protein
VVYCAACSIDGSSYIALATNTNQDPPTQTSVWQLIAQAGATGATGAVGATGPVGPEGPTGPAGSGGSVTDVTVGIVSNTAAQGAGTLTITDNTSTPTLNINFPNYTLPTELTTLNTFYTSGHTGTGVGVFFGNDANGGNTCTIGDTLLSTQSYSGGAYLPADGRTLLIANYTALFSLLGINFGGNGTSNFDLPNLTSIAPPGMYYSICINGIFPLRN